jgi:general nucleoside transport system permease protein
LTDFLTPILSGTVQAATPLILAGTGELVAERSGVINLGVEGMMLCGAIAGFAMASTGAGNWPGLGAGAVAGAAAASIFCVLTLTLLANQIACGLALTIFGIGLSAFVGQAYTGVSLKGMPPVHLPVLSDLPLVGAVLFRQDGCTYVALALFAAVWWVLARTKAGLIVRAVGESSESAHAIGYPVIRIRYLTTLFGGAMAGLAGAYLAIVYTPFWTENMTAGRGWIAVALVAFATWRPSRLLLGAYLFGGVTIVQFHAQGLGVPIPSELLSMLPYLATIVVLVLISRNRQLVRLSYPAALGKPFLPGS